MHKMARMVFSAGRMIACVSCAVFIGDNSRHRNGFGLGRTSQEMDMEMLNILGSPAVRLWLTQATVIFFVIAGITLLVIGVGLIVNSAGSLRLFGRMNHWVSLRSASKPLEIPRDTRVAAQKYRYWLAVIFVCGGIFAVYGLVARFNAEAVIFALDLKFFRPAIAAWLIDGARWLLVAGNLAGIVTGFMLAFAPQRIVAIESRGSHWYSERKMTKGADDIRNLKLDVWVEAHPRFAGWGIVLIAVALTGAFGLLLPRVW